MHRTSRSTRLRLYEGLCDSLRDSVLVFDVDGRLFYTNRRFREATGVSADEFVGCHYSEFDQFIRDDSLADFRAHLEAVTSGEATERRVELAAYSPLEGDVVVEARVTAIDVPGVQGVVVVLRDVTESLRLSETLARRSEQLAVINAVLRHDIRNDMSIILGWAEILEGDITTDEERDILDRILRHGSHVVELTHAARKVADAIEVEWEMELRPTDLRATLTREVEAVREQFPGAEFVVDSPVSPTPVLANEFLGPVVSNLLTNAVRHNDAGTPRVRVTVERADETVRIAVADNGPGIPDAQKKAVYELGEKGPGSPGTGLGLYLVQSLVDAYGGTVTIADNEPRGTVVTVELRLAA